MPRPILQLLLLAIRADPGQVALHVSSLIAVLVHERVPFAGRAEFQAPLPSHGVEHDVVPQHGLLAAIIRAAEDLLLFGGMGQKAAGVYAV